MSVATENQRLLLRAIVGPDSTAVREWQEWESLTDLERLDPDSQWLLPALDQNLRRLGVRDDRLSRYHNVYRHNWYKNHLVLHRCAAGIGDPRRRNRVVILGGAAMAMAHYKTLGERPFEEVEVLLRDGDSSDARSEAEAESGEGAGLCRLRRSLYGPAADEALARRSAPLEWRSLRAHSLEPVDQLVDICARRQAWDGRSRLLWQVDVVAVLRRHPSIEWSQVERRAEGLALGEAVEAARRELESAVSAVAAR